MANIKVFVIEEEDKNKVLNLANNIAQYRPNGVGTIKIISTLNNDNILPPKGYVNIYTFTEFVKDRFKAESIAKTILSVIYLEGYVLIPVISIPNFIDIYENYFENYSKYILLSNIDEVTVHFKPLN